MKKILSTVLACTLISSAAAAANYTVKVGNDTLDLGKNEVYTVNGQIMVPVRAVGEKLGFTVTWDDADQRVLLDDGEVNTRMGIGDDSYYMASSVAIGMSAPTPLGAAPELKDDTTFVPAKMFDILCGAGTYKADGDVITFTKDSEPSNQIPNPFTEYKTVDEAVSALTFSPMLPTAVPSDYKLDCISTLGSDFLQIVYKNGDKELMYRTAVGSEDISGDYNVYKNVKKVNIAGAEVTVREADGKYSIIWNKGENAFALYSDGGLTEKDMTDIINNLK